MSDLMTSGHGAFLPYLHGRESELDLPKPFEQEIHLFDTYVAGTTHVEGIETIAPTLKEHDRLIFLREPDNPYDPQAIRIETMKHVKIGYVPRKDNVVFARLMDAGKVLFGKIEEKEMRGRWLKMKIKIYLLES